MNIGNKFRRLVSSTKEKINPLCSRCGESHFLLFDQARKVELLKEVKEYKAEYQVYKKLCRDCWSEISTFGCGVCKQMFDVTEDTKKEVTNFLKRNQVSVAKAAKAKHICPNCSEDIHNILVSCGICEADFKIRENKQKRLQQLHSENGIALPELEDTKFVCPNCYKRYSIVHCCKCHKKLLLKDDKIDSYDKNPNLELLPSDIKLNFPLIRSLCVTCYDDFDSKGNDIRDNLNNWINGVRSEYIPDYRVVKRLGKVSYDEDDCQDPLEVKEKLKLLSAQLGGNGFVEFFWKSESEVEHEEEVAGYGHKGNPYYRNKTTVTKWITGSAIAVRLESKQHHSG